MFTKSDPIPVPPSSRNRHLSGDSLPSVTGTGRPPGRDPSPLEADHLDLLVSLYQRARRFSVYYDERLEDFVAALRADGCSARSLARAVGVSSTTIQTWTRRAQQRQASPPGPLPSDPP